MQGRSNCTQRYNALRWQGIELRQFINLIKMNRNTNVENLSVSPAIAKQVLPAVPSVALVFGSRSRHIAFNGELLCETNHKSAAGGHKHGHYCSYSLDSSAFTKERTEADVDYKGRGGCHSTGIIPFKPLNEIEPKIIERSICKKCLSKYNRELSRHGR